MAKGMKKVCPYILIAFFGLAMECYALSLDELITRLQGNYDQITDIQARFSQEYINKSFNQVKRAEGRVYFKKPGMMRWKYRKPVRQEMVSDGSILWFYQPEDNQVIVGEISKTIRAKTPTAFLSGEGNLRRDFRILSPKGESQRDGPWYLLELAPIEPQVDIQRLVLRVDTKSFLIVQTEIYDAFENVNRTHFSGIKVNRNLPDSLFTFIIPPGTQVLRSPGESTR
jgi:outer membrane lipoprotein carrier protein